MYRLAGVKLVNIVASVWRRLWNGQCFSSVQIIWLNVTWKYQQSLLNNVEGICETHQHLLEGKSSIYGCSGPSGNSEPSRN